MHEIMKKILLLLIMLVNLQVVIRCNYIGMDCGLTASAQHMTREAGDNCQDDEDGLWYYYANMALCNNGPEILGYPCHYCNQANDSEDERRLHEWCCPYNPENQAPWWNDDSWDDSSNPFIIGAPNNSGTGENNGIQGSKNNSSGAGTNLDYYFTGVALNKLVGNTIFTTSDKICRNLPLKVIPQTGKLCLISAMAYAKLVLGKITSMSDYTVYTLDLLDWFNSHTQKIYANAGMTYTDQKILIQKQMTVHNMKDTKKLLDQGNPVIAFVPTTEYNKVPYIWYYTKNHNEINLFNQVGIPYLVDRSKCNNFGRHAVTIIGYNDKEYLIYNPWGYYQRIPKYIISVSQSEYKGVYTMK